MKQNREIFGFFIQSGIGLFLRKTENNMMDIIGENSVWVARNVHFFTTFMLFAVVYSVLKWKFLVGISNPIFWILSTIIIHLISNFSLSLIATIFVIYKKCRKTK